MSSDRAAVRRAMILKAAAFSIIALVSAGLLVAWFTSYNRNSTLIALTADADNKYLADAGPYAKETLIGDHDLHKVLPLLNQLRDMPAGYASRQAQRQWPPDLVLASANACSRRQRTRITSLWNGCSVPVCSFVWRSSLMSRTLIPALCMKH